MVWSSTVTRIAVARLVPVGELAELASSVDQLVAWEVADHFDVDHATARAACRLAAVLLAEVA